MTINILAVASLALVMGSVAAQNVTDNSGSASVSYFSESRTSADGGRSTSASYALQSSIGNHDPNFSVSPSYQLRGGFTSTIDTTANGPWVTAATPHYVTPRNSSLVWLRGTQLSFAGPATTVTVSGKPATVVASSSTDVAVRVPPLLAPGWHPVTVKNSLGSSSLERGFGVLPILYTEGAPASEKAFDLIFKGTKGDSVIWALGFGKGQPIPIGNFLHGFEMWTAFFRTLPTLPITADSGELRLSIPPVPFQVKVYVQGLFITKNPAYSPGSFSNRLEF